MPSNKNDKMTKCDLLDDDNMLKLRDLLLEQPQPPTPRFKSEHDADSNYIIVRAFYGGVCGDYMLYNNDGEEVVWFSPSRPHKSNLDMIEKLLSCYITDECSLTSLQDVYVVRDGQCVPEHPHAVYYNAGHIIRGVIERTIKNYIIYLCPLFRDLVYRIPYGREHESPSGPINAYSGQSYSKEGVGKR